MAIAALIIAFVGAYAMPIKAQEKPCRTPLQIGTFYGPHDSVMYGYKDAGAQRIIAVIATFSGAGAPPGNPSIAVFVGLDLVNQTTDFFLCAAAGCFTAHFGPVPLGDMIGVLDAAGVGVPFGRTYHQLPDVRI